jgi:two-component system OmpR family response regulator
MRVMLADDDYDLLELIAGTLEDLGDEVVCASSSGALERGIAAGGFDTVVTDVSMPEVTGLSVVQSARDAGQFIPTVVITGMRDRATSEQVAALGAHVALLYKPFSITDLRTAMRACLSALV